jgi:hypothetical protein
MSRPRAPRFASGIAFPTLLLAIVIESACSNSTATNNTGGGTPYPQTPETSSTLQDGNGHTLKAIGTVTDPGANAFLITISGEVNAISGYPYPPFDISQTWMVDGWNWKIEKYIVVIDKITLWSNPNMSSTDQSQHGPAVAQANGPFVVDLHKGGLLAGMGGGGEQALPFATITNQNVNGGAGFDPSTTYGFGFSTVQAPGDGSAINVNLDASEQADYQYMVAGGYSVYYYGTATWAGNASGAPPGFAQCTQTSTNATSGSNGGTSEDSGTSPAGETADDSGTADTSGTADASGTADGAIATSGAYDFTKLPPTMTFQLGFSTPTNYVNCINYTVSEQENQTVRGVQSSTSQSVIAQVTIHMDHPFWESFAENSPVHWDPIAAQYIGVTNPVAHTEDLKGVPFDPFTDKNGNVMPWRDCEPIVYTPPGNGAMIFSTLTVPVNPNGTCTGMTPADFKTANCPAIRDYYDYIRYTQSTQGHLNSQGLCYIDRQYPAPVGGS